jgi:hypothetical protein
VRSMARSDHCRWVSTPRWARLSSKVVSKLQRFMGVTHDFLGRLRLIRRKQRFRRALSRRIAGEDPPNGQRS